jgi:hypothetical protein
LDGTWSNEAASPAANDHSDTSINEPGTKMRARTGTVSVPAYVAANRTGVGRNRSTSSTQAGKNRKENPYQHRPAAPTQVNRR